jgi:hypothetical protein
MDKTLIYPMGSILIFSTGEYSDYGLSGFVVTLKECDLRKLAAEYRDNYEPEDKWDKPRPEGFAGWLIAKGYAMPVEASEVHLGSYGDFDL